MSLIHKVAWKLVIFSRVVSLTSFLRLSQWRRPRSRHHIQLQFYTLGRLFFHYSHFNGNSNDLRLHDEVEFEVIIDRDNRKVATRVMKLKKGTINFESFSPERVNGEVASPPSGNHPGSLSYNSTGEFFFLPFGASDISSACQLYKGWLGSRGVRSREDAIFITF